MRIEVRELVREFGHTRALDEVSFYFESGHIFGFIGPNGAGKTTTMRVLATLDEPDSGDVLIDGVSVIQEPEVVRRFLGFVPDALPAHRDVSVHEYLDFFARAHGLMGDAREEAVANVEAFTNLGGINGKCLHELSKGMKQRVSLARALIHDPKVLVLDEPAAGLDPKARIELRELLQILREQGKAILISSHILSELSEMCDGAIFIEQGKILKAGVMRDVMDLGHRHRTYWVRTMEPAEAVCDAVLEMPLVERCVVASGMVKLELPVSDETASQVLAELVKKFRVIEFKQQQTDLEDVFMSITKGKVQ